MRAISPEQANRLIALSTSNDNLFFSVGKIFVAAPDPNEWSPNCEGFIQIVAVPNSKISYINLYEFGSYELVFQHEIYENFSKGLNVMGEQFVAFQSDNCVIGIAFSSPPDAKEFENQVKKLPKKNAAKKSGGGGVGGFFKKKENQEPKPPKEKKVKEKPEKEVKEKPEKHHKLGDRKSVV